MLIKILNNYFYAAAVYLLIFFGYFLICSTLLLKLKRNVRFRYTKDGNTVGELEETPPVPSRLKWDLHPEVGLNICEFKIICSSFCVNVAIFLKNSILFPNYTLKYYLNLCLSSYKMKQTIHMLIILIKSLYTALI